MVAEADVVRVTDHVIQDDLLGSCLRALQPEPETKAEGQLTSQIPVSLDYGIVCLYLSIRPILVSASSRKCSSGDRTTPLGM